MALKRKRQGFRKWRFQISQNLIEKYLFKMSDLKITFARTRYNILQAFKLKLKNKLKIEIENIRNQWPT